MAFESLRLLTEAFENDDDDDDVGLSGRRSWRENSCEFPKLGQLALPTYPIRRCIFKENNKRELAKNGLH